MANVAIEKHSDSEAVPETVWQKVSALTEEIRQRAFSLFEKRAGTTGSDVDDWLQAEREVSPTSELIENKKDFRARIALPGFDAKDIEVTATPNMLIVQAESTHTHEDKEGDVCFCEFSGKTLFRRLDLPAEIDVDHVAASFDKGVLEINSPKAMQVKRLKATA